MFDMLSVEDDDFHVDLGFMYGIPSKSSEDEDARDNCGYTALPRQCCLKELVERFNSLTCGGKSVPKIKSTYYTWALTKDIASLTIEPPACHPLRNLGLSFLQIYPSHKNLIECQGHYPYPVDDESGVCLAMDDHMLKALYSAAGRPIPDQSSCRQSWRHSGRRIGIPLRGHFNKSFFTRIEVRISRTLWKKISIRIEQRRQLRMQNPGADDIHSDGGCPFYIHQTKVINDFMSASTQVLARLFQEIISLAPEGHLSIDHQKLLVQIYQLQKVAHCAVILPKFKYLFNSIIQAKKEKGLGLKDTIQTYGYGYPKHGLIDWMELNFTHHRIVEQFPHPTHALYRKTARPLERRQTNDLFQEVDLIVGRIRMEQDEDVREIFLDWLAMRLVKQFHIDIAAYLIYGPYKFKNKDRLAVNPDEVENENEEQDIQRRRCVRRVVEEIDSEYEAHSSGSEV